MVVGGSCWLRIDGPTNEDEPGRSRRYRSCHHRKAVRRAKDRALRRHRRAAGPTLTPNLENASGIGQVFEQVTADEKVQRRSTHKCSITRLARLFGRTKAGCVAQVLISKSVAHA